MRPRPVLAAANRLRDAAHLHVCAQGHALVKRANGGRTRVLDCDEAGNIAQAPNGTVALFVGGKEQSSSRGLLGGQALDELVDDLLRNLLGVDGDGAVENRGRLDDAELLALDAIRRAEERRP